MAKSRSSNPADAFRKAQRAKELKKNKDSRKKVRDAQTVKRDTRDLELEIQSLKSQKGDAAKTRLGELEKELAYVKKAKEAYVKEHPEARDKVFGTGKSKQRGGPGAGGYAGDGGDGEEGDAEGGRNGQMKHLYDEQGRLRDPTRSVYYDKVYNPWGVPPPGMPYRERPLAPGEAAPGSDESDSDEDSDSDSDIVMPEGPPPGAGSDSDGESDDSDDIPLPTGPPPPKGPPPTAPSGPASWGGRAPPVPVPLHGAAVSNGLPFAPRPPAVNPSGYGAGHSSTSMGMGMGLPQAPAPAPVVSDNAWGWGGAEQNVGPGWAGPSHRPPRPQQQQQHHRPPRGAGAPPVVQDPLSDEPTQTYQGHRLARAGLPPRPPAGDTSGIESASQPGLPVRPTSLPSRPAASEPAPALAPASASAASSGPSAGEISAAPQLRDLRKETTVFVPRGVKKRDTHSGAKVAAGVLGRINAAPGSGEVDAEGDEVRVTRKEEGGGLLGKLKGVLGNDDDHDDGPPAGVGAAGKGVQASRGGSGSSRVGARSGAGADDDYERFLAGLGDLG